MKHIEDYIRAMTDIQIKEAFLEYEDWRETGILKQGIIRETIQMYRDDHGVNFRIDGLIEPILYEIAKRKYRPRIAAFGDTIKIIGNSNSHDFEIGQIVRVCKWNEFDEEDEEYGVEASDGKVSWFIRHEDYEVIR